MFWESIHNILTNSIFSMLLINSATFGTSLDLSFENSGNDLANGKNLGNLSQNEVTPLPTTIKSNETENRVIKGSLKKEITNVQDSKMNLVSKIQLSPKPVNIYQPVSRVKNEQSGKNSKKIPTPKEALEQNISFVTKDNKAQEPVVNHIYFYKERGLPTMDTQPTTIANNALNALESYSYQKEETEKTSENAKAATMLVALAYILSTNSNPEEQEELVYNYSPPIARLAIFLHTYSKNKATQISSKNINAYDFTVSQIKLAMNRMLTEFVSTFAKETFEKFLSVFSEFLKTFSALFALGIISYLFRSRRRHSAYLRNILGAIYEFCHAFFVEKTQPAYEHSENQPEFEKIFESSFFIGYKFDPKFTELCNRQIIMRERLKVNV